MAVNKLTKNLVSNLSPSNKAYVVWDNIVSGFGVRVLPSGVKSFVIRYYNQHRRERWQTIGRYGILTVDQARDAARQLLASATMGGDPAEDKAQAQQGETIADLVNLYMERHAIPHKAPRSVRDDLSIIHQHVLPRLGKTKVKAITKPMMLKLHGDLGDTPIRANRTLALLSKMFSLAENWGIRPEGTNPCLGIKKFKENVRRRYLSGEEMARLGQALAKADREGTETPYAVGAIRLLLFTGMRLGEVLPLRWDYIDSERSLINLPTSKTGAKTIPLNKPSLEVLGSLPRVDLNPYVIIGNKSGRHLVNLQKPWQRIRAEASLNDVRLHDLRHSFASVGAAAKMGLPIIGGLLGHTQAATTQRYAHLADDPLQAASERISQEIAERLNAKPEKKVLNFDVSKGGEN